MPSSFHKAPNSLRKIMQCMESSKMESWSVKCEQNQCQNWTMDYQGISTDGESWFAVNANNNKPTPCIYKFNLTFSAQEKITVSPFGSDHIGPPNCFNGKIYVPVEGDKEARVWTLDTDLKTLDIAPLGGGEKPPQDNSMPWCAINPLNGLLYSSKFGKPPIWEEDPSGIGGRMVDLDPVTEVHCYDPAKNFAYKKSLTLTGKSIHKVQGGCFSTNGHLYLTSDATHEIHGFSVLNGYYFGGFHVPSDWYGGEEMEGIAMGNYNCPDDGSFCPIHVLVLDNDWPQNSDIYFKHVGVPSPELL